MSAPTRYQRPAPAPIPSRPAAPRRPAGPTAGRMPWAMAGAVFVAVTGAALGLDGVLAGWAWLFAAVVTVGAVLLVAASARALRVPDALVPVLGVAALIVMLTLQFFSTTAFLGLVPTKSTLDQLGPLLRLTSDSVIGGVPPVDPADGILLVVCAGLGLVALLVDALAVSLSMPASSGLGLLAVLMVPALVKPDSVGALGFLGAAAGYLLILGCSQWYAPHGQERAVPARTGGQLRRAAGIGGAAVVVTVLLQLVMPGFDSGTFPEGSHFNPFGNVSGLNPMITLGNDLRNPNIQGEMTYATDSEVPLYLRSTTLEDFTGKSWAPSNRTDERRIDPSHINDDFSTAAVLNGVVTTTRIDSRDFGSPWLPAPYAPLSINGLVGRWTWDPKTLTVAGLDANSLHQTYVVRSVMPILTRESLERVVTPPRSALDPQFLQLPKNTPELIRSTALAVTGRAPTPYDKAMALQDYLRGPDFSYSEQTPVQEGYDGSGMDVVAKFLQAKSGYCVHFAAAMAVMAREAGIPSRIAVGYAPGRITGNKVKVNGQELTEYSVDAHNAHAWPELYFEGVGWVPFEPTPTRGQVPAYALRPATPGIDTSNPNDALSPGAAASAPAPAGPGAGPVSVPDTSAAAREPSAAKNLGTAAAAAVLLLILSSPLLVRTVMRRRRFAVLRGAFPGFPAASRSPAAAVAWAELQDLACDYGVEPARSETPRAFAQRLLHSPLLGPGGTAAPGRASASAPAQASKAAAPESEATDAVRGILARYERITYGPPDLSAGRGWAAAQRRPGNPREQRDDARAGLTALRSRLQAQATAGARLRALLLPPSTFRRWRSWWQGTLERPVRAVRLDRGQLGRARLVRARLGRAQPDSAQLDRPPRLGVLLGRGRRHGS